MKRFLLLILLFSNLVFSQNEESKKYVGFEIYLLEKYERNPNSYRNLSKKQSRKLFKKYKKTNKIPDSICYDYLNWDINKLEKEPFLSKKDIKYYDWDNYTVLLTDSGIEKIKSLDGNVFGVPFAIVINNEIQFGGKFNWSISSQINDRVFTRIEHNLNKLKLYFFVCGKDPRNTKEFKNNLVELIN